VLKCSRCSQSRLRKLLGKIENVINKVPTRYNLLPERKACQDHPSTLRRQNNINNNKKRSENVNNSNKNFREFRVFGKSIVYTRHRGTKTRFY